MELQEKEEDKDENYIGKLMRNIKGKSFLFTLDLKANYINYSADKQFQSLSARGKKLLT